MGTGLDVGVVVALGTVICLGALVQSSVGFGIAVVAAPFVVLLEPSLMPVSLLICGSVLPLTDLVRGPREIAFPLFGWAFAGRLLLTPVGVMLVVVLPASAIAVVVGVLVLGAVALSVRTVEVRATRGSALGAGLVSGVSGTSAAVGGPFFAIVLQHEPPVRLRSTLAAFLFGGATSALIALGVAGELHRAQLLAGLIWIPFLLAGNALGHRVRRYLDAGHLRAAVLVLATLTSVSVIIRTVVL